MSDRCLVICILLIISCQKENELIDELEPIDITPSTEYWSGDIVEADFMGQLNNMTLNTSYQISIGNKSTIVEEHGHYMIRDVEVDRDRAILNIQSDIGEESSIVVIPSTNGFNRVHPHLTSYNSYSFSNGAIGLSFTTSNGSRAVFDDHSLIGIDGEDYSEGGSALFYSVQSNDLSSYRELAKGGMIGTDRFGELKYLFPFSGYSFDIYDDLGYPLQLKNEVTYRARIYVPAAIEERPETVPIWKYEESTTVWREIATAMYQFSFSPYGADLNEFGNMMLAVPYDAVMLTGRVLTDISNSPLYSQDVYLETESIRLDKIKTDEDGYFRLWAPAGLPLSIRVVNECANELFDGPIGTLEDDTEITIEVSESNVPFIKGRYSDCYGQPIPGYLRTDSWQNWRVNTVSEDGEFRINIPCWQQGAWVRMFDQDFDNPTDSVYVLSEDGETLPSGVHIDCDLPYDSYMIYSIDGSEDLSLTEVNVDWNLATFNNILDFEFESEIWGDTHTFTFSTWDYPEIEQEENIFIDEPILEILNAPTLLGRFEISDDFEFEYLGLTDREGSTMMFSFEGTMNSTIGMDDIEVSGIGVVKRP